MDSMQQKFGNLAHTKTDLSQELLITEEEKLKVIASTTMSKKQELNILLKLLKNDHSGQK